jgi:CheY-like chemotaxis protein
LVHGHVLYVEDDDVIRELYAEALRGAGLTVREERCAERALERLACALPDVILLDLGMPTGLMSGMEMLARLRNVAAWARIPVVVLSAFGDVVNPDIMARLNVSNVLSKTGVHGEELARLVGDIVERRSNDPAAGPHG